MILLKKKTKKKTPSQNISLVTGITFCIPVFFSPQEKLAPESAHLLKKLDEEQEADEEDISDDEAGDKEESTRNSSPNAVRQRPVNPAGTADKS